MINSYPTIDKLFGAPLNVVPRPNVPFKVKGWHVAVAAMVAGFAVYGMYCTHRDVLKYFRKAHFSKE
jgi:hypothetical protein